MLGVRVYSTVILGVKLKYVVFFWLGSWAKILCLVIKKNHSVTSRTTKSLCFPVSVLM